MTHYTSNLNSMNNLAETLRAEGDLTGARVLQDRSLHPNAKIVTTTRPTPLQAKAFKHLLKDRDGVFERMWPR